jgi:hypothetical protein
MDPATSTSEAPEEYYSQGLRAKFMIDGVRAELKAAEPGTYADIHYEVDQARYLARSEARVKAGGLPTNVPEGWPTELKGPLVWSSTDYPDDGDDSQFVYRLTAEDKAEILEALKHFKGVSWPLYINKHLQAS